MATRRRIGQRWALLAIVLLAFGLRAYDLGRGPLWFDEALSSVIATKGVAGIVAHSLDTPFEHPPLYYLLLHLWTAPGGDSSFSLRFFSLFWGVLLVPLLYRFVASWGGRRLALLTALVAAISATHVDHSQNARMYTLVAFLGVLSLFFFFRGLQEQKRRWWLAYLFTTATGITIHYYFALLLLVPIAFLVLHGRRHRRVLVFFVVILLGAGVVGATWLMLSPGPRQAMLQILRGEGAGASSLALRIRYTVGGLLLDESAVAVVAFGLLALVGLLFWPTTTAPGEHPVNQVGSRRFVLTWLMVPWLVALAIPYWLQSRHLAYLWPALYTLIAAGLLAFRTKGRWLFAVSLLLVGGVSAYGIHQQDLRTSSRPDYGQAIAVIEDRALPNDLVVVNQPSIWPFLDHYGQEDLKVVAVPNAPGPLTAGRVAQELEPLLQNRSRIWLGPIGAWTADPESLVEQWLARHTFQADKTWFPGSISAGLYFTAGDQLKTVPADSLVWDGRILLQNLSAGPFHLQPGDAVRLRFQWRAGFDLSERYAVELSLVDGQGRVWAQRRSEPCSGWCPTDNWPMGSLQQDQHALLVPAGTPPGSYHLQLAWFPIDGGPALPVEEKGQPLDQVSLAEVIVLPAPPGRPQPKALANPLAARFGDEITLLGYNLSPLEARPGDTLHLETTWRAEKAPAGDYALAVELMDGQQRPVTSWDLPPSASFFPTSQWQPGQYLRGQQDLVLPHTLAPGRYGLRLALATAGGQRLALSGWQPRQTLDGLISWQGSLHGQELSLAQIQVRDRPRQFEMPAVEHPLDVTIGRQAHLRGYALDTSQAHPGGQVRLTLYWQADGPMAGPFKVFTHLVDDQGITQAQHDSPPGGGCCPTNTWAEGEINVDEHPIPLKADLPPGTYRLQVGMYDEDNDTRLPAYAADGQQYALDRVPIETLTISATAGSNPRHTAAPEPAFEPQYRIFLPAVVHDRP